MANVEISLAEAFNLAPYAEVGFCLFLYADQEVSHIGKIKGDSEYTVTFDGLPNTIKLPANTLVNCHYMGANAAFAAIKLAQDIIEELEGLQSKTPLSNKSKTRLRLARQIQEDTHNG